MVALFLEIPNDDGDEGDRQKMICFDMFILTNNNFPRASRYFEHFFAVVAPLQHETS